MKIENIKNMDEVREYLHAVHYVEKINKFITHHKCSLLDCDEDVVDKYITSIELVIGNDDSKEL